MKLTFKHWLIAFLSAVFLAAAIWAVVPVIAASADTGGLTCETASGNYLNADYISVYRVPTDMMTYEATGGGTIANAFDGNWNSYWETKTENKGQNSDNPEFLNAITVTFSQPVTIESIAYASSSARLGHGYPVSLNLYTANGGGLSLYGACNSSATNDRVVFRLKETITVTQIKFEFRKVNTMHNWTATAKEICFLQPDNASANKVLDLFDDYAQFSVKDEYKTQLSEMRGAVSGLIGYESALKPLLDRAEAILSGQLIKDSRREFSTDPKADNVINQYGDLRSYAGNTLKMSSFGINRQVLGVGGLTGDTITVYVEAEAGDPLPSIAFNQVFGDWRSWQSTCNLSLGKNVLTFPNFITDNYSWTVVPGGAVHLINPYEPSRQSSNVKIYVEGGFLYPVFRKGGDVEAYRTEVASYYGEMQKTEGTCNITELVCDHVIQTFGATTAYNNYVAGNVNPQKSAEGWDNYMTALLEFGGVSFNPEDEHYNEKNLHLYTNFRRVQPWAGAFAFAAGDHIGFIDINENSLANYSNNLGWGFAHEVGHSLDVNGRTIGETTNNMWSKFATAYFENNVDRNFNADTTRVLSPDETALSSNYFNANRYNYQIWWNLEACHHGFWGRLDNTYRYFNEAAARTEAGVTAEDGQLSATERIVYYSSLAVGEDLGYYYERFGFSFESGENYVPFRVETASAAYKKLIKKALDDKKIEYKGFKYWYIDAAQYYYDFTGNDYYSPSTAVEIREIWKTSSGYTLLLTEPPAGSKHLGYEIMEYRNGNWSVIGFTTSGSFTDTTEYPDGYVPQYKIRGYDREMSVSGESQTARYKEFGQAAVCRTGETYYDCLAEAVEAANAGDTVYICTDLRGGGITIDKNLTILPDPSLSGSVVITKDAAGAIFTVNKATVTIGSIDGAKIVLDGNSFSQNGALINVNGGTLRVYNAELCNNNNTDHGGAVYNTGNSAFTNVTFKNNITSKNGGAIANFSGGVLTLTDCTVSGNRAKGNGGAFALDGRTALIGTAVTENTASGGGAMFVSPAKNYASRFVSIEGGEISGNTADKNGSAIYHDKGIITFDGSGVKISGEIYKNQGSVTVNTEVPDFSEVTFSAPFVADGTVLLTANGNLTFTRAFAESLKSEFADAYLGDGSKTVLLTPWVTVKFSITGAYVSQQVKAGSFVLPDTVKGIGESKYITEWEFNGKPYAAGATVEITGDCIITASAYADKCAVTTNYGNNKTSTHYFKPGESLVLGECSAPEGQVLSHWDVDGKAYNAGDTVLVTGDTVITAVFGEKPADGGNNGNGGNDGNTTPPAGDDGNDGNDGKDGSTPPDDGSQTTPSDEDDGGKPNTVVLIVIIAAVLLLIAGLAVALIFVIKREKSENEDDEDDE